MSGPKGGYPADIVSEDTGWGRIHEGHGLSVASLKADYEHCAGGVPDGCALTVDEVWFGFVRRVKWCEPYIGWGCDQEGDWHSHWYAVRPAPGFAYTVVGIKRTDGAR